MWALVFNCTFRRGHYVIRISANVGHPPAQDKLLGPPGTGLGKIQPDATDPLLNITTNVH